MAEIDSTDDGRVDLRKRARRRLVGACALALLAVIVLPMVMDEEPKPLTQDIQIRIPSQDSPAPAARPMLPPAESKPAAVAEATQDKAGDAKIEPKVEAVAKAVEEIKPAPADAKAVESKPAEAKVEAKPQPKPEAKAEPKPEAKPEAKPAAKPEPKPAAKAAAKSEAKQNGQAKHDGEQWVVQLGAYQEAGNVKVLLAKIKELGYSSYTEKVSTEHGVRTRVRAGPFASREQAEKAQAALKRISAGGPSGGVVAPK